MRLNAQRVNRHVFFANAPKHGQDGLALSFLLGRVGFDTVIVIREERGRIGFGGGAEGELDVILADIFQPDGVDHVVVVVVVGANGFRNGCGPCNGRQPFGCENGEEIQHSPRWQ